MTALALRTAEALPAEPCRSAESLAFEAMWRGLRGDGLVPERADFRPAKAVRFLKNIVLAEVPPVGGLEVRIRLAGSAVEARVNKRIAGDDYIQYLPEGSRAGAVRSAHLMTDYPCGLWQMTRFHYANGTSHVAEMTGFPLRPGDDGVPLLLFLSQHTDASLGLGQSVPQVMLAEPALDYRFLDLGHGVPEWSA